jgi:hypothetical protein
MVILILPEPIYGALLLNKKILFTKTWQKIEKKQNFILKAKNQQTKHLKE